MARFDEVYLNVDSLKTWDDIKKSKKVRIKIILIFIFVITLVTGLVFAKKFVNGFVELPRNDEKLKEKTTLPEQGQKDKKRYESSKCIHQVLIQNGIIGGVINWNGKDNCNLL